MNAFGACLAKCLPERHREAIADAIPDRDVLIAMAERVASFERNLAVKKAEKAEELAAKKALKTVNRLKKATAARSALL